MDPYNPQLWVVGDACWLWHWEDLHPEGLGILLSLKEELRKDPKSIGHSMMMHGVSSTAGLPVPLAEGRSERHSQFQVRCVCVGFPSLGDEQITGTVNPRPAPAGPSAKEDVPARRLHTDRADRFWRNRFPIQCKELIERQRGKTVEQKPAAVEEKPIAVDEKPAQSNPKPVTKPAGPVAAPSTLSIHRASAPYIEGLPALSNLRFKVRNLHGL
jgi:hypothetical protein